MPLDRIEIEAHKASYPERSCRDAVHGQWVSYNCELPELHKGPCVSWTVRASLQRRKAWEDAQKTAQEPS